MTAVTRPDWLRRALLTLAVVSIGCADTDDDGDDDAADDDAADDDAADDDDSGSDSAADGGMMRLTFSVGGSVAGSPNLVDPLLGTAYGGIFRTADVGATGPREGAEQVAYAEAVGVDLTSAMVSTASWTSEPLPPDSYTFLGFLDVDGSSSGTDEKDPEEGDPVTLPSANKVTIETGTTAELVVRFDLVL
jgi:hypothetical protein